MNKIKEKLGQMFIIRMQEKEINDELISLIKDYHVGGISLYSKNYDSYEEMIKLINELKRINSKYNNTPLFISIDEEGGRVDRLPKEFVTLPSAKKISSKEENIIEQGKIIGEVLSKTGINLDFAPVLDIQRFPDNHAIGDRCFGDNKESVAKNGLLMMKTLNKYLMPVVKHFPGHGLIKRDSHMFLSKVIKNVKESDDIYPFLEAIKKEAPAIMVSHLILKQIDKFNPASLSKKVITGYIREELNYNGLIITDDLKMKSVNVIYGYKRAAFKAINAGNDLVLIGSSYSIVKRCIDGVITKMNANIKDNIDSSYERIINMKNKYKINDLECKPVKVEKYNERINKLRNNK